MASASTPGIAPQQIEADIETYLALKVIDNYTPHNARDALLTGQHDFHDIILGAKNEVRALFGPDSDQIASLGLKKKSELSKPKREVKGVSAESARSGQRVFSENRHAMISWWFWGKGGE